MDASSLTSILSQFFQDGVKDGRFTWRSVQEALQDLQREYGSPLRKNDLPKEIEDHLRKRLQLSDRCFERVWFVMQHLWYRGVLTDNLKMRKQAGWQQITEDWNTAHPYDQVKFHALKESYHFALRRSRKAMLLFSHNFKTIFDGHCRAAMTSLFGRALTAKERKLLEQYFCKLVIKFRRQWEGKHPLTGNALLAFTLEHWEDILQFRRTLYCQSSFPPSQESMVKPPQTTSSVSPIHFNPLLENIAYRTANDIQLDEEYWTEARKVFERFSESITCEGKHPNSYRFRRSSFPNIDDKLYPTNISDNADFPLYFLGNGIGPMKIEWSKVPLTDDEC